MSSNISEKALRVIDNIIEHEKPLALFLCGSCANGYEKEDSDIDVVAIIDGASSKKAIKKGAKVETHYINKDVVDKFEIIYPYSWMRIVPFLNENLTQKISKTTKTTIVKNEFKNLTLIYQKSGKEPKADVLFPIINFSTKDTIKKPWRMKPFERLLHSEKTLDILRDEYQPIFDELVDNGTLIRENNSYQLSPNFIFSKQKPEVNYPFSWKASRSWLGFYYLKNLNKIRKYRNLVV